MIILKLIVIIISKLVVIIIWTLSRRVIVIIILIRISNGRLAYVLNYGIALFTILTITTAVNVFIF